MPDTNTEKKNVPAPTLELLATLYTLDQLKSYVHDRPQIALAGRSNVGKSSLINALARRKKLAKVSSEPGKTRSVNLFEVKPEREDKGI
ncbi:MAG: 50S ribosome-binding GTPase, partial [Mailhella sp.]|nr:50S ribosome-binding GTPase [Mailhella sp.]